MRPKPPRVRSRRLPWRPCRARSFRCHVGASVGLWWFGQSLTDVAPYIADARKLDLPLLGGGTGAERDGHDWQYLLNTLGLAPYDVVLGTLVKLAGGAVMLLAVAWGGWLLWRVRQSSDR